MRSRPDLLSGSPYRVTSRLSKIPIVVVSSFAAPWCQPARSPLCSDPAARFVDDVTSSGIARDLGVSKESLPALRMVTTFSMT
jgi:hypothetical protein